MNREYFQRLSELRLKEAKALLAAELPDGAYYLAGYSVEFGRLFENGPSKADMTYSRAIRQVAW